MHATGNGYPQSPSGMADSRRIALRWIISGVFITLLMAISTTWQSWERNTALAEITSLPVYFAVIWISLLLWIPIALLIYRLHIAIPMFTAEQPFWWFRHLLFSFIAGSSHLLIDTLLLWLCLSGSFDVGEGYLEKLIRWLPYELLAYWACLSLMTLFSKRRQLLAPDGSDSSNFLQRLSIKIDDETHLIPVEQIDYIQACDNYVQIWRGRNSQLVKETMTNLEQQLNPGQFMRIHRSFIVNLNAIDRITRNGNQQPTVIMKHGKTLPVSRRRRAGLNQALKNH